MIHGGRKRPGVMGLYLSELGIVSYRVVQRSDWCQIPRHARFGGFYIAVAAAPAKLVICSLYIKMFIGSYETTVDSECVDSRQTRSNTF